jgi:hypothetical protein
MASFNDYLHDVRLLSVDQFDKLTADEQRDCRSLYADWLKLKVPQPEPKPEPKPVPGNLPSTTYLIDDCCHGVCGISL